MRKLMLLLITLFLMTFLIACGGGDGNAGDTNNQDDAESNNTEESADEEDQAADSEPSLEIVKSTGGAWIDSIDTVWVHSSAIYENTGDVPVDIGETQMNFKGKDGSILGTASMVYSVPRVVGPGEQAYITETTMLDGVTDPAEYAETTYNFGFDETDEEPNLLEVSGVKGIADPDSYMSPYKVTGVVKNTTEELQDDIRISAALLAEDGSLLGVLEGSVDVGVNPGSEAGFELTYPEIPADVANQVKTVEVKAYGWTW